MTQFNRLLRRLLVLLSIFCIVTGSVSCSVSDSKEYESYSAGSETTELTEAQIAFDTFTDDLFYEEITENTLNLHYMLEDPASSGIEEYPLTLGEFGQSYAQETAQQAEDLIEQLEEFSYEDLTSSQKLTWDILQNSLELSVESAEYPYYEEVLQPSIGLQAELPVLLAEYTFNTETDITDYLAILEDVERYFDDVLLYEQEKADAGLFMSDYCADMVISDCESFISQIEDNFLITTFEERLDEMEDLDSSKKEEYIEENYILVTENIVNAYETLIDGITQLKGSGVNDGGLGLYEDGKDYYMYLLRSSVGTDREVEDLEKMAVDQINSDLAAMQQLLSDNPDLEDEISDFSFSLTDPEEIIADLQEKMLADFPELTTEINLSIKYVSESMEDSLSPAFYLTPPVDNLTDNVIYINGGSSDASSLYSTLAHEGYPGHLYQTVYSASCSDSLIRNLCSVTGFSEGWATYVENLSYSYDTGLDESVASLMQHNNSANLGIYALLDLYINYEGWSLETTHEWLQSLYNIDSIETTKELYYYIVSQPTNYLNYYVGYLEILDLKADAEEELGDSFDLKQFHTFLLEIGDAPFYIIREYMESWMESF